MLSSILLQSQSFDPTQLIMIGGMIVIFYFFFIRPQQKKQKDQKSFINEVKKGDRIITMGGLHGKVHSVEETTIIMELDKGFKVTLEKSSISLEASKKLTEEASK